MTLAEIGKLFYSRYNEIFNRIDNNMDRFSCVMQSERNLLSWAFIDKNTIAVKTHNYWAEKYNEIIVYIETKYLENDDVFNKWLTEKYETRKNIEYNTKYKKGERVYINDIDWYNSNKNKNGNIKPLNNKQTDFCVNMAEYCGKLATIEYVFDIIQNDIVGYHIDIDNNIYIWQDWVFDNLR